MAAATWQRERGRARHQQQPPTATCQQRRGQPGSQPNAQQPAATLQPRRWRQLAASAAAAAIQHSTPALSAHAFATLDALPTCLPSPAPAAFPTWQHYRCAAALATRCDDATPTSACRWRPRRSTATAAPRGHPGGSAATSTHRLD